MEATDLYTRQSCLTVTTVDLAVMGATLAEGGVNPLTGEQVVSRRRADTPVSAAAEIAIGMTMRTVAVLLMSWPSVAVNTNKPNSSGRAQRHDRTIPRDPGVRPYPIPVSGLP